MHNEESQFQKKMAKILKNKEGKRKLSFYFVIDSILSRLDVIVQTLNNVQNSFSAKSFLVTFFCTHHSDILRYLWAPGFVEEVIRLIDSTYSRL